MPLRGRSSSAVIDMVLSVVKLPYEVVDVMRLKSKEDVAIREDWCCCWWICAQSQSWLTVLDVSEYLYRTGKSR